ncbi:uncharacterized protein BDZ83DRAFT_195943 [Colletotrichum acutatum]|uniref:Uncharacterized protein n=1 Tax=Glomerella acutata TaxID=27357 RepID=A0AAD8XJT6_GLOAC|nr:uncharacterized protein BDZ83DRAFT_195943 [Colletotrichum acutatum]KAK1727575.1 hypothetical protein BDZ83DRAFT_195943 [Colletotrichum acutatum]
MHPQPCRPYQDPITVFVSYQAVAGAMAVLRLRGLWIRVPLSLGSLEVLAHILLCELVSQTRTLFHLGRRVQYPPQGTVITPIPSHPIPSAPPLFFSLHLLLAGWVCGVSASRARASRKRDKMCCAEMDTPFRFRARNHQTADTLASYPLDPISSPAPPLPPRLRFVQRVLGSEAAKETFPNLHMLPMSRLGTLLLLGHQFRACAEIVIPSLDDSCGDDASCECEGTFSLTTCFEEQRTSASWAMCSLEVPDWKVRRADERQDEVKRVIDRSRGDGN